jgi:TonB family protein
MRQPRRTRCEAAGRNNVRWTIAFLLALGVVGASSLRGIERERQTSFTKATKGPDCTLPHLVHREEPGYPDEAESKALDGVVHVIVELDSGGHVVDARVTRSSAEVLEELALRAALQWRFEPQKPEERLPFCRVGIPFWFSLGDSIEPAPETPYIAKPAYPDEARRQGLEGSVDVIAQVDEQGGVIYASVIRTSSEVFTQAALEAAYECRFNILSAGGKRRRARVSIPFRFTLKDSS